MGYLLPFANDLPKDTEIYSSDKCSMTFKQLNTENVVKEGNYAFSANF